jgi:hypothetical protein
MDMKSVAPGTHSTGSEVGPSRFSTDRSRSTTAAGSPISSSAASHMLTWYADEAPPLKYRSTRVPRRCRKSWTSGIIDSLRSRSPTRCDAVSSTVATAMTARHETSPSAHTVAGRVASATPANTGSSTNARSQPSPETTASGGAGGTFSSSSGTFRVSITGRRRQR